MASISASLDQQMAPSVPAKRSLWIQGCWRDLILYVGTPLLLIPLFAVAQVRWTAQEIFVFVGAFGALGHHLPGMIRAYGDPALFERFRWRFIFAPVFLLTVCVGFYFWDVEINPVVLIVFFWGTWHVMMQTYGFGRIYDAKTGSFAGTTRRLDFAVCAVWFAAAVILSPARMNGILGGSYACGLPFISPPALHLLQQAALIVAITVLLVWLANFVWMWIAGSRQNPVKIALFLTSIAFWWYCNNGIANILAGIALFEVFHDVQYLSIVWIYNRNRVEKDSSISGFMRFVFRRSGSLMGLYVGLVLAYGSIGYLNAHLDEMETMTRVLTGVIAASALLHYYYDGFIWKVREKSTRQSLGLVGGTADATLGGFLPSWALHGAKWAVAFVLPLTGLFLGRIYSAAPELDQTGRIVSDLPSSARAHFNHGAVLEKLGRVDEAFEEYQAALQIDPNFVKAHVNLANLYKNEGKLEQSQKHFEKALALEPGSSEVHFSYAYLLERLGRPDDARTEYQRSIKLSPKAAPTRFNFGAFLETQGELDNAIAQYQRAVEIDPNYADAQAQLATALLTKGDIKAAEAHYLEAVRLNPKRADIHSNLGSLLLRQGRTSQAIVQYEEALRIDPTLTQAAESLRVAREGDTRFQSRPQK